LFSRNINKDIFDYAGYDDISWDNVSNRITNKLSSNTSIVTLTAIENITNFAVEKGTELGAKGELSFFTSKANIYVAATQLATFVTSLAFKDLHEAYSADMNAIWLNTVQYDIAKMASRMLIKERDEGHFRNMDSLEKLKNMFALYYRISIAFSENLAISINEFGGKNKNEWVDYFSATKGKSLSNYMAVYLYLITNCTIVPIADYSGLSDTLIKADWINAYESSSFEGIFQELDGITFVFTSGAGSWSTEVEMKADGSFSGYYHDSEAGVTGANYLNGTRHECYFEGRFIVNEKIDDFTYSMELEGFDIKDKMGEEKIVDGIKIIITDAYGFDNAGEFMLYLPGRSTVDLSDEFLGWVRLGGDVSSKLPFYGLYNINGEAGFFSYSSKQNISIGEMKQLIISYYKNMYNSRGDYVSFDDEIDDTSEKITFTIRYQMSDEEAQELIENGGFPSANTLVSMVTVDKGTGQAVDDIGNEWNLY